jgi:predicted transcriptional regulator of viral defense system
MWQNVDRYTQMYTLCHMPVDSPRRLRRLAQRRSSFSRSEVAESGIHTNTLSRLVRAGEIERVSRGRYRLPDAPVTEHHGLALVAAAVPKSVVCLISALSFHQIGTQLPHQVWIAVDRRARGPSLEHPPLRVLRFSGTALTEGIETHRIEGIAVRVYSPAKTIADLFKYRNKIGLDVALEALREGWRERRFTIDEVHRYARICRVERVMTPYLELLVA